MLQSIRFIFIILQIFSFCLSNLASRNGKLPITSHNGTVVGVMNDWAGLEAHREYGPYGDVAVAWGGTAVNYPYTFQGREDDGPVFSNGDNLMYFRSRYYMPRIGRFISRDPLGFGGGTL